MEKLSDSLIKTASLAMLEIEDEKSMLKDMEEIILMARVLNDVQPCCHEKTINNDFLREDTKVEYLIQEELLKNAPCKEDGFVLVPKTII